jgi:hypothetical protein
MVNKSKSHEIKNQGKVADEKDKARRKTTSRSESMRDDKGSKMPRTNQHSDMKSGSKNS